MQVLLAKNSNLTSRHNPSENINITRGSPGYSCKSKHCYKRQTIEYTIHNDELNEWNTLYINWMNETHLHKLNEWNTFTHSELLPLSVNFHVYSNISPLCRPTAIRYLLSLKSQLFLFCTIPLVIFIFSDGLCRLVKLLFFANNTCIPFFYSIFQFLIKAWYLLITNIFIFSMYGYKKQWHFNSIYFQHLRKKYSFPRNIPVKLLSG
jgi:hypothetical protein